MFVGNLMLVVLNVPLVGLFVSLLRVPAAIMSVLIVVFCVIGAFSLNNSLFDVGAMIGFGILGYGLRKAGYDVAPLLLAFVLGSMFEQNLRQGLIIGFGNPLVFLTSPISAAFLGARLRGDAGAAAAGTFSAADLVRTGAGNIRGQGARSHPARRFQSHERAVSAVVRNPRLAGFRCIRCDATHPIGDYAEGCPACGGSGYPASVVPAYSELPRCAIAGAAAARSGSASGLPIRRSPAWARATRRWRGCIGWPENLASMPSTSSWRDRTRPGRTRTA